MLEIDFLKVAQSMEASGIKGRILPLVKRSVKNIANGRAFRLVNKPGSILEIEGIKHLVTNQGKLTRI